MGGFDDKSCRQNSADTADAIMQELREYLHTNDSSEIKAAKDALWPMVATAEAMNFDTAFKTTVDKICDFSYAHSLPASQNEDKSPHFEWKECEDINMQTIATTNAPTENLFYGMYDIDEATKEELLQLELYSPIPGFTDSNPMFLAMEDTRRVSLIDRLRNTFRAYSYLSGSMPVGWIIPASRLPHALAHFLASNSNRNEDLKQHVYRVFAWLQRTLFASPHAFKHCPLLSHQSPSALTIHPDYETCPVHCSHMQWIQTCQVGLSFAQYVEAYLSICLTYDLSANEFTIPGGAMNGNAISCCCSDRSADQDLNNNLTDGLTSLLPLEQPGFGLRKYSSLRKAADGGYRIPIAGQTDLGGVWVEAWKRANQRLQEQILATGNSEQTLNRDKPCEGKLASSTRSIQSVYSTNRSRKHSIHATTSRNPLQFTKRSGSNTSRSNTNHDTTSDAMQHHNGGTGCQNSQSAAAPVIRCVKDSAASRGGLSPSPNTSLCPEEQLFPALVYAERIGSTRTMTTVSRSSGGTATFRSPRPPPLPQRTASKQQQRGSAKGIGAHTKRDATSPPVRLVEAAQPLRPPSRVGSVPIPEPLSIIPAPQQAETTPTFAAAPPPEECTCGALQPRGSCPEYAVPFEHLLETEHALPAFTKQLHPHQSLRLWTLFLREIALESHEKSNSETRDRRPPNDPLDCLPLPLLPLKLTGTSSETVALVPTATLLQALRTSVSAALPRSRVMQVFQALGYPLVPTEAYVTEIYQRIATDADYSTWFGDAKHQGMGTACPFEQYPITFQRLTILVVAACQYGAVLHYNVSIAAAQEYRQKQELASILVSGVQGRPPGPIAGSLDHNKLYVTTSFASTTLQRETSQCPLIQWYQMNHPTSKERDSLQNVKNILQYQKNSTVTLLPPPILWPRNSSTTTDDEPSSLPTAPNEFSLLSPYPMEWAHASNTPSHHLYLENASLRPNQYQVSTVPYAPATASLGGAGFPPSAAHPVLPPPRTIRGQFLSVAMHMVDGWLGAPGSDPWYCAEVKDIWGSSVPSMVKGRRDAPSAESVQTTPEITTVKRSEAIHGDTLRNEQDEGPVYVPADIAHCLVSFAIPQCQLDPNMVEPVAVDASQTLTAPSEKATLGETVQEAAPQSPAPVPMKEKETPSREDREKDKKVFTSLQAVLPKLMQLDFLSLEKPHKIGDIVYIRIAGTPYQEKAVITGYDTLSDESWSKLFMSWQDALSPEERRLSIEDTLDRLFSIPCPTVYDICFLRQPTPEFEKTALAGNSAVATAVGTSGIQRLKITQLNGSELINAYTGNYSWRQQVWESWTRTYFDLAEKICYKNQQPQLWLASGVDMSTERICASKDTKSSDCSHGSEASTQPKIDPPNAKTLGFVVKESASSQLGSMATTTNMSHTSDVLSQGLSKGSSNVIFDIEIEEEEEIDANEHRKKVSIEDSGKNRGQIPSAQARYSGSRNSPNSVGNTAPQLPRIATHSNNALSQTLPPRSTPFPPPSPASTVSLHTTVPPTGIRFSKHSSSEGGGIRSNELSSTRRPHGSMPGGSFHDETFVDDKEVELELELEREREASFGKDAGSDYYGLGESAPYDRSFYEDTESLYGNKRYYGRDESFDVAYKRDMRNLSVGNVASKNQQTNDKLSQARERYKSTIRRSSLALSEDDDMYDSSDDEDLGGYGVPQSRYSLGSSSTIRSDSSSRIASFQQPSWYDTTSANARHYKMDPESDRSSGPRISADLHDSRSFPFRPEDGNRGCSKANNGWYGMDSKENATSLKSKPFSGMFSSVPRGSPTVERRL